MKGGKYLIIPRIDEALGISIYATKTKGLGGIIKKNVDDFIVEEVLVDGSVAKINKKPNSSVLSSSIKKQKYLLCVLIKKDWDTFSALRHISKKLEINENQIWFAGIKDAKAITAQHITIENSTVEKISTKSFRDIMIYPIGYFREHLSAYYLFGNNFTINVSELNYPRSEIKNVLAKFTNELDDFGGVPNYFGHQRFGTIRPITHIVGKAIINDDFEKAVLTYLTFFSEVEHPSSKLARKQLDNSQNYKQALVDFPKNLRYERILLKHLANKPTDFVGAFSRLPFKLQALFVQAYQSYLFNLVLSERIKQEISLEKATVGDYVVNVERSGLPMVQFGKIVDTGDLNQVNRMIRLGRLRVALPLIGIRQKLSKGKIGEIQRLIYEKESVKSSNFRVNKIPRISGKGSLRTTLSPIVNFRMKENLYNYRTLENNLTISFSLLKGSYATILLRELIKPTDPIAAGF